MICFYFKINSACFNSSQNRIHIANTPRNILMVGYKIVLFFSRTSLFIISSFIYAKLLVVVCLAYVISDVITHNLPLYYYEGFFTYLYGMSILFLLYVFCFLLQGTLICQAMTNYRFLVLALASANINIFNENLTWSVKILIFFQIVIV